MVELPPGVFTMGSPPDEVGYKSTEGPQRHIRVPHRFALGKFEVTIDQFSAFVAETGVEVASSCFVGEKFDDANDMWKKAKASFRQPGFEITGSHPVTCVNWYDAHAYTVWLTRRTGKPYRLPTEAEWEYAARAGTTTAYNFGSDETRLCTYARFADFSSVFGWRSVCRSGISTFGTLQVGTLEPNAGAFRHVRQRLGVGRRLLDIRPTARTCRWLRIHRSKYVRNKHH
jgi:formylglycine-generating enzyme required for sulfatase activity